MSANHIPTEDDYPDDYDLEFDATNAEFLCLNCGTRERILNGCCATCCELRPDLMGHTIMKLSPTMQEAVKYANEH